MVRCLENVAVLAVKHADANRGPGMYHQEYLSGWRCKSPGCKTQPSFGFPGERRASRCKEHRLDGMVRRPLLTLSLVRASAGCRLRRMTRAPTWRQVNVANLCEVAGCRTVRSFGFLGRRARRCRAHVLPGMVRASGVKL